MYNRVYIYMYIYIIYILYTIYVLYVCFKRIHLSIIHTLLKKNVLLKRSAKALDDVIHSDDHLGRLRIWSSTGSKGPLCDSAPPVRNWITLW